MYIGNNYMVSTKLVNGLYHNEYFIDEKSAIAYANECYKRGDMEIELLHRGKCGYYRVKKSSESSWEVRYTKLNNAE